ncbi:MAG: UbiA family prenyltransferase [Nitrososphaeria archaeon]
MKELIELIRLPNCILSGFGVIVGAFLVRYFNYYNLTLGFLVGFFITAYSMVINDYFDIEVDKINSPQRPFASGRVSVRAGLSLALLLLLLGIATSAFINLIALLVAFIFALISFLYSWKFKKMGLLGNSLVALSMAIPFIYGSIIAERYEPLPFLLAGIAFFAGLSREVIKGISDVEGDSRRGIKTVAIEKGSRRASELAFAFMTSAVVLSLISAKFFETWYLYLPMILAVDYFMLERTWSLIKDPTAKKSLKVKNDVLKLMFLALAVFLISGALAYVG